MRSVRFELMAYHEECWAVERLTRALTSVPEQRRGTHDAPTRLPDRH